MPEKYNSEWARGFPEIDQKKKEEKRGEVIPVPFGRISRIRKVALRESRKEK